MKKIISYLPLQYAIITSLVLLLALILDETNIVDGDTGIIIYIPLLIYLLWRSGVKKIKGLLQSGGEIPKKYSLYTSLIASLFLLVNPQFWIMGSGHPPIPGVVLTPFFFIVFLIITIFSIKYTKKQLPSSRP